MLRLLLPLRRIHSATGCVLVAPAMPLLVLQVFPVEYHVSTLQMLLDHLGWLCAATDVKALLVGMMERLNSYSTATDEQLAESEKKEEQEDEDASNPFVLFSKHIASLALLQSDTTEQPPMSLEDQLELHLALLAFCVKVLFRLYPFSTPTAILGLSMGLKAGAHHWLHVLQVYPNRMPYIDEVLSSASAAISATGTLDGKATGLVLSLVTTPLAHLSEALLVLSLEQWSPLISHLSHEKRKEVASSLVCLVIEQEGIVSRAADAAKLLQLVGPLLVEDPSIKVDEDDARPEPIDADTAAELGPVSRLIHRFAADDTDGHCRILNAAHRQGASGSFRRSPFAFVPIIFSCLSLTRR